MIEVQNKSKILIVTNMYPHKERPHSGIFVKEQIDAIKAQCPECNIDIFHIRGYESPLNYLKAIFKLRRILQKKKYDLIHAHYGLSGLVSIFQNKVPVVCTFHGGDVLYIKWQGIISRAIAPIIRHNIAVSEKIREKLHTKRVSIIPCGIDFKFFKPIDKKVAKERLELDLKKKYILFPGNIEDKRKNYPLFKKVVNLLKKDFNVKQFILWGLSREEVLYALNSVDVVVFTSYSEGSVMVLKEALACNTPVISVGVGDAKKILQDMKGCYITSNDAHKLYKAVSKVLNKKGNSYSFRNKIKHLSNKIIASRIVDIYHVILTKQTDVKSL